VVAFTRCAHRGRPARRRRRCTNARAALRPCVVADEDDAMVRARSGLLSYLPVEPPRRSAARGHRRPRRPARDPAPAAAVAGAGGEPPIVRRPGTVHRRDVLDEHSLLELRDRYCGQHGHRSRAARRGAAVGVGSPTSPMQQARQPSDIDRGAEGGRRFVQMVRLASNLPVVHVRGHERLTCRARDLEWARHHPPTGAQLPARVRRRHRAAAICVVLRKAYGGAYIVDGFGPVLGRRTTAYAWPTAEDRR